MAFARLKTLAGNWKGQAAMGPQPGMNAPVRVSLRVTSGGAALMHEMVPEGRSDDPSRGDDDPITMLYIDGNRLVCARHGWELVPCAGRCVRVASSTGFPVP